MLPTLKVTEKPLKNWMVGISDRFLLGNPILRGEVLVSFREGNNLNLQKKHEALLERGFSRVSCMIFGSCPCESLPGGINQTKTNGRLHWSRNSMKGHVDG